MNEQMESIARLLENMPQGVKAVPNAEKLEELAHSEAGQTLQKMLRKEDADTIRTALYKAMNGERDSAKEMVMSLLSTKEGAALAGKLANLLNENH